MSLTYVGYMFEDMEPCYMFVLSLQYLRSIKENDKPVKTLSNKLGSITMILNHEPSIQKLQNSLLVQWVEKSLVLGELVNL